MPSEPVLTISLDFELLWGVRDKRDRDSYGTNILGAREAIPRMLDLFEKYGVHATWATVGFLFCESKEELIAVSPELKPAYQNKSLSNYSYFDEVGENEKKDPYYFGSSLISEIASRPGQEVGSHSYSHYYCLECGQSVDQFEADLGSAVAVAQKRGIKLKSFVYPRNQSSPSHNDVLRKAGFTNFRGNQRSWVYRATDGTGQSLPRRALRLADNYFNLTGHHGQNTVEIDGLTELAASSYLRSYSVEFSFLERLRLQRIMRSMTLAADNNQIFHLWWHPHDFGNNLDENLTILEQLLQHFSRLQQTHGMISKNMAELA